MLKISPQLEIQIIAIIVALACNLPGNYLFLKKMSLMSDSISHTVLLGIVLGFFLTNNLSSPILIIFATLTGLITVYATEALAKTKLVSEDSSIGLIFPLLFSIAVILISKYANDMHLDVDMVLLGNLVFAPFDRFIIFGKDIGPKSMYIMGFILILNLSLIIIFYKELKISSFDYTFAKFLGFKPKLVHYALMTIVSLTTVGAFNAVGSILVIALMVGPPATAFLITNKLKNMLIISSTLSIISAVLGFKLAFYQDISISGAIATSIGFIFGTVFLFKNIFLKLKC